MIISLKKPTGDTSSVSSKPLYTMVFDDPPSPAGEGFKLNRFLGFCEWNNPTCLVMRTVEDACPYNQSITLTALRESNVLKPQFVVSLVCHCEELRDAAISIKDRYLMRSPRYCSRWHHKRTIGFYEWNNPTCLVMREGRPLPYKTQQYAKPQFVVQILIYRSD